MPSPLTREAINALVKATCRIGHHGGAIGNNCKSTQQPEGRDQQQHTRYWIDRSSLGPAIRVFGGKPVSGISEEQAVKNIIANMGSPATTLEKKASCWVWRITIF